MIGLHEVLKETYTDALVVIHGDEIVYEKFLNVSSSCFNLIRIDQKKEHQEESVSINLYSEFFETSLLLTLFVHGSTDIDSIQAAG